MATTLGTLMMKETRIVTLDVDVPAITTEAEAIEAFGLEARSWDGSPANLTARVIDLLRAPARVYLVPMTITVAPRAE